VDLLDRGDFWAVVWTTLSQRKEAFMGFLDEMAGKAF
jgi:hypothetical protein